MVYPRISIVTPSFNQAAFLTQTIDSVLSQNYPNLEYIIIDGGSMDGSAQIIERHAPHLAYSVSEKDRGQSHAINKGFAHATGEIQAYLNSDDYLEPGALHTAAEALSGKTSAWLCGGLRYFDNAGYERIDYYDGDPPAGEPPDAAFNWFYHYRINQPATFWTAELYAAHGPFNESLRYVFDWEFFTRIRFHSGIPAIPVRKILAHFRLHDSSKTVSEGSLFDSEIESIWKDVMGALTWHDQRLALERRRFAQADRLQVQALALAGDGRKLDAMRTVLLSLKLYPPLLFQRRTLGAIRRAATIF